MEKLLTIVIPAYNMEKYLHRCLDSIIVESVMDKVQVIVVNDGSKDRTSEIAHKYENMYPHYIQVIDKENGNYGSCMNMGLSLAKGKYFRTLDSDDWYDTEAYEKFVYELEMIDADLIICQIVGHFKNGKFEEGRFDNMVVMNTVLPISASLWKNKSVYELFQVQSICYKTSIIRESGLEWSEKVFYSDSEFDYWPLKCVNTVAFIPLSVYHYDRERDGQSTTNDVIRKNYNSFEVVSKKLIEDFVSIIDCNTAIYEIQMKILKVNLLTYIYSSLIFDGFLHKKAIDTIELMVAKNKDLYAFTNNINNYRDFKYVDAYRNNRFKFVLMRLDYLLRSNKFLRRLFGK